MAKVELPESSLNFPGNSHSEQAELIEEVKPRAKKVIKGKAITKKRSFGRKFADIFFGEEVVDVKGYILQDVLVPSIKDTISDIVTGGIDMLLFGERRARSGRRPINGNGYTSYSNYYGGNTKASQGRVKPSSSSGRYYIEDVILDSRGDAEEVLGNMIDTIKDYGMVSVADLYDMVNIAGVFTDHSWGWFDLGNASVRRVREGYMLVLPKVESLK